LRVVEEDQLGFITECRRQLAHVNLPSIVRANAHEAGNAAGAPDDRQVCSRTAVVAVDEEGGAGIKGGPYR